MQKVFKYRPFTLIPTSRIEATMEKSNAEARFFYNYDLYFDAYMRLQHESSKTQNIAATCREHKVKMKDTHTTWTSGR